MNIWQGLLFLSGDLGGDTVKTFAAEELALEAARREQERERKQRSEERRFALDAARRRARADARELRRCA
jgi:hypothetical protein